MDRFDNIPETALNWFRDGTGAALATGVGVLVEVPVMLSLVALANRTKGAFAEAAE